MHKALYLAPLLALVAAACGSSSNPPPAAPPQPTPPPAVAPGPEVQKVTLESVGLDGSAIDRSVDPCQDFYGFACGDWIKKTEIPADKPRWVRSFNVIDEHNQQDLKAILENAEKPGTTDPTLKKLGAYYAACMDETAIDKAGLKPIMPLIKKAKSVYSLAALGAAVTELHRDGIGSLFEFSSDQDFKDATRYIGEIDQGGLGLPDRDYYTKTDDKSKAIRDKYQAHVAAMMKLAGYSEAAAQKAAADVMEIETGLAEISKTKVERRDPKSLYNKIDLAGVEKAAPHFDWKKYLEGIGFPKITDINVTSVDFVKGMDALLEKEKMPAWQNYLVWHILHSTAGALPKPFVDESFKMKQVLTGQKEIRARWKRCVDSTDSSLGELLAQPFVKKRFGGPAKQAALDLVHQIGKAFIAEVDKLDWMDAATKQRARDKFQAMAYLIGYPDHWREYDFKVEPGDFMGDMLRGRAFELARQLKKIGKPVDRGEWEMTPPTVNAYYNPQKNQMVFPAGILQPPFYNVNADVAVNLGAMGMVVGHELTHGFDDEGSQFDKAGNLSDWWTPKVKASFQGKTGCVADQYGKYEPLPGVKVNGKLTTGENIADMGGVKLAFAAYRALRKDAKTAYVADGFTEDQQFFLSTGQIWCAKMRDEYARMAVSVDPHSPPRFRVNGALADLPQFAEAFSCKKGTPMNPDKACSVW